MNVHSEPAIGFALIEVAVEVHAHGQSVAVRDLVVSVERSELVALHALGPARIGQQNRAECHIAAGRDAAAAPNDLGRLARLFVRLATPHARLGLAQADCGAGLGNVPSERASLDLAVDFDEVGVLELGQCAPPDEGSVNDRRNSGGTSGASEGCPSVQRHAKAKR